MKGFLEWQPVTISLFLGFITGTFLCVFFVLKILFFGKKLNPINGLYLLSFLVMGLLIPYLVNYQKILSSSLYLCCFLSISLSLRDRDRADNTIITFHTTSRRKLFKDLRFLSLILFLISFLFSFEDLIEELDFKEILCNVEVITSLNHNFTYLSQCF